MAASLLKDFGTKMYELSSIFLVARANYHEFLALPHSHHTQGQCYSIKTKARCKISTDLNNIKKT